MHGYTTTQPPLISRFLPENTYSLTLVMRKACSYLSHIEVYDTILQNGDELPFGM